MSYSFILLLILNSDNISFICLFMVLQLIRQILNPVFQVRDKSVDYLELLFESIKLTKQEFIYFSEKQRR